MALSIVSVEGFGLGIQAWAGQSEPDMNRAITPRPTSGSEGEAP